MTHRQTRVIETERLILRHLTLADLDDLFALYQETGVRWILPDAPRSYAETQDELSTILENYDRCGFGLWAAISRDSGAFIGRCGLSLRSLAGVEEVEVAVALAPAYWQQGLATEAARAILRYGFDHLHLPRLVCLVSPRNEACIRVAQKIGMVLEREITLAGMRLLVFAASPLLTEETIAQGKPSSR